MEKFKNIEQNENIQSSNFFTYTDIDSETSFKIYGMFLSFEGEKQKLINLILFKKDKSFSVFLKNLLEKEDIVKILFFTKQHFKILNKIFNINIKAPCYDPIVANWLLTQESISIFQVKQKYCANLNLLCESRFKNSKTCFGCCSLEYVTYDPKLYYPLQGAFIECLIGINCYEKLKLQLQLQNIWIYFAKVESDIVLLSAQIELNGFGLNLNELEKIKMILLKKKKEIEDKVFSLTGKTLNLNSTDDVSYLIFNVLKLKPPSEEKSHII